MCLMFYAAYFAYLYTRSVTYQVQTNLIVHYENFNLDHQINIQMGWEQGVGGGFAKV